MNKKIIITGATGSIGRGLSAKLIEQGNDIIVFSRNPEEAGQKILNAGNYIDWNYNHPTEWKEYLEDADIIIHLAGANLGAKRWNDSYKKLAYESRVLSTKIFVDTIKAINKKPKAFICSSAVGIYGNRYDEVLDEKSLPASNYLADLCKDWEMEAAKIEDSGIRRVSVRTGLVLDKNEGLMKQMVPSFKLFLGGYLGNGKQWFPWIHIDDIVEIYLYIIANENINGPVNAASPGTVRMKDFAGTLGKVLNRPALFPIPKLAVKLLKGELGNYTTDSQRICVDKILKSGYKFRFENLNDALRDLLG